MRAAALASLCATAMPALAGRVMVCELRSAIDSSKVLDVRTIREGADGQVVMRSVPRGGLALVGTGGEAPVLFQQTTNNADTGRRFTTLVVASTYQSETYTPVTWLVDWEARRLLHTNLAANGYDWTVFKRYQCGGDV